LPTDCPLRCPHPRLQVFFDLAEADVSAVYYVNDSLRLTDDRALEPSAADSARLNTSLALAQRSLWRALAVASELGLRREPRPPGAPGSARAMREPLPVLQFLVSDECYGGPARFVDRLDAGHAMPPGRGFLPPPSAELERALAELLGGEGPPAPIWPPPPAQRRKPLPVVGVNGSSATLAGPELGGWACGFVPR
jgi:hypothetical protein